MNVHKHKHIPHAQETHITANTLLTTRDDKDIDDKIYLTTETLNSNTPNPLRLGTF